MRAWSRSLALSTVYYSYCRTSHAPCVDWRCWQNWTTAITDSFDCLSQQPHRSDVTHRIQNNITQLRDELIDAFHKLVEPTRIDRLSSNDFLLVIHWPSHSIYEINGNFGWKSKMISHPVYLTPLLREFPLEFCNGSLAEKLDTRYWKNVTIRLDTIAGIALTAMRYLTTVNALCRLINIRVFGSIV